MEDLLIITAFLLIFFTPMWIMEQIAKYRETNRHCEGVSPWQSTGEKRHKYDTVYNWFYNQLAKEHNTGINIPDFMNRQLIAKAHAKAVYIAQSGKLNSMYRKIKAHQA